MKKIIPFLFFVTISNSLQAQQQQIDKAIIKDFAVVFFYKYKYENNQNLKAWAYYAGNVLGYGQVDTEIAVERLESDSKFRNELFRTFLRFSNSNEELLTLNLISIGMQPSNAKKLGKYILEQYQVNVPIKIEEEIKEKNEPIEYVIVDKQAQFFGGDNAFRKYLTENTTYPDSAVKNEVSGIIEVRFVIDKDGSITDAKIISGQNLGFGLPEEALRVIRSMPKWEPAMAKGKPLKSTIIQKLTFAAPPQNTKDKVTFKPVETKQKAVMKKGLEVFLRDTVSGIDIYKLIIPKEIELAYEKINVKISNSYDEDNNVNGKDYTLFPNTTKELIVMSDAKRIIGYKIAKQTNRWKLPFNLKVGMTLEELKQINGVDFMVTNFETDAGGLVVDWNKGKLAEFPFSITLLVKDGSYSKDYNEVISIGDKISTAELLERPFKIIISEIIIWKMN